MSKEIRLTWKNTEKEVVTEEVLLVDDNDPIYTVLGEVQDLQILDNVRKKGWVLFEDDFGIFCVKSYDIIKIEEV